MIASNVGGRADRAAPSAAWDRREIVERAVSAITGPVVALPRTELSGFRGHPLVKWLPQLSDRLANGPGPILDRPTLSLWESTECEAPSSPLEIVGFVSTARWRHAIESTRQLRGFGACCVLVTNRPSRLKLMEADYAGVYVILAAPDGTGEVLVHGSHSPSRPPRMIATRYWEERLFATALAAGYIRSDPRGHL